MDELARSQLAYLIQGLLGASTRKQLQDLLDEVRDANGSFSSEVQKAIEALVTNLPTGSLSPIDFQRAAKRLLQDHDGSKQQAGRALAWALELRPV